MLKYRTLSHSAIIPAVCLVVVWVLKMPMYARIAITVVISLWLLHIVRDACFTKYREDLEAKERVLKDMRMLYDGLDTKDPHVNNLLHLMMVNVSELNLTNMSIADFDHLSLDKEFNPNAYAFMQTLLSTAEESLRHKKHFVNRY